MTSTFHRVFHDAFILLPAFLSVFTVRGFSKALSARLNGDRTAASEGFISLNPLAHIDLSGLLFFIGLIVLLGFMDPDFLRRGVMFSFLAIVGVRWTYEVPIDEAQFYNFKRGVITTTLAGPVGNFFLALIGMYAFTYLPFTSMGANAAKPVMQILQNTIQFSIFFGVIDLVPIPPFDGGRLLPFLLPSSMQHIVTWLHERALYVFLFLFVVPVVSDFFFYGIHLASSGIYGVLARLVF